MAIQDIAITMRLTLHRRYQLLKTKQRRNQRRRNQHHVDRQFMTPVRSDVRQPDGWRSLSPGHIAKRTGIGNSSLRSIPPKRTVCYQQRECQQAHFIGQALPFTCWGYGDRTAMVLLLTYDEEAVLSKLCVVWRTIGNAKRGCQLQRFVGQPE